MVDLNFKLNSTQNIVDAYIFTFQILTYGRQYRENQRPKYEISLLCHILNISIHNINIPDIEEGYNINKNQLENIDLK